MTCSARTFPAACTKSSTPSQGPMLSANGLHLTVPMQAGLRTAVRDRLVICDPGTGVDDPQTLARLEASLVRVSLEALELGGLLCDAATVSRSNGMAEKLAFFISGGIWATEPVSAQPTLTAVRWQVRQLPDGERHIVGCVPENREGRVSSAIAIFDPTSMRCVTSSDRVYQLLGDPAAIRTRNMYGRRGRASTA